MAAAAGTSIMIPSGMFGSKLIFWLRSSSFDFLEEDLHLSDLLDLGDHRDEDADVPLDARPENGPELDAEQLPVAEGKPDRPQTEGRVRLLLDLELGQGFLAADVDGPDIDGIAGRPPWPSGV